jgi:hypothetical protein
MFRSSFTSVYAYAYVTASTRRALLALAFTTLISYCGIDSVRVHARLTVVEACGRNLAVHTGPMDQPP